MFQAVFDLEGPLSPQDNAYEVMRLIENGDHIFEVISKYDDVLALQGRKNYEPGDTLKLIVPFLILNGISENDIRRVSKRAKIVSGATELINWLTSDNWKIYIISTSYEQHAHNIAEQVGVARDNVYSTRLPLDAYLIELKNEDMSIIEKAQSDILSFYFTYGVDTTTRKINALVNKLDKVFFNDIPKTKLGKVFNQIKVIGGERKVTAMIEAIGGLNHVKDTMAIGDSITDYKMLKAVKEGCGLSIAFNGNAFSLPYASIAVASEDLRSIYPLAKLFTKGGRELAFTATKLWEDNFKVNGIDITKMSQDVSANEIAQFLIKNKYSLNLPHINLIESTSDEKLRYVAEIHKRFRSMVRGAAVANLG
jgi:energy-converting hydrogenase A subunit R